MSFPDSDICGRIEARLYEPPDEVEHLENCPAFDDEDVLCLCRQMAAIEAECGGA